MPTLRPVKIIAASAIAALGLAAGLALAPHAQESGTIVGVCGGDRFLFRVYDDGAVHFLDLKAAKTVEGIAGWTPLPIDHNRRSNTSPSR